MLEKGVHLEGEGRERNRNSEAEAVITHLVAVPLPGTDGLYNSFAWISPLFCCVAS